VIPLPGVRPKTILCYGGNVGAAASSMARWGLGTEVPTVVDSNGGRIEILSAGRLKKLRVRRINTPGVGTSVVYTVRINGVNSTITCTMANGPTTATDLVNSAGVVPGDVVEINVAVGGGAPANDQTIVSLEQEF